MTTFTDRLMAELPDPDQIGKSEYRVLHEHVENLVDSMREDSEYDDPRAAADLIYASLDEVIMEAQDCVQAVTRALRT